MLAFRYKNLTKLNMRETIEAITSLLLALIGLVSVTGVLALALTFRRDHQSGPKATPSASWASVLGEILRAAGNALRHPSKPVRHDVPPKLPGTDNS